MYVHFTSSLVTIHDENNIDKYKDEHKNHIVIYYYIILTTNEISYEINEIRLSSRIYLKLQTILKFALRCVVLTTSMDVDICLPPTSLPLRVDLSLLRSSSTAYC